MLEIKKLKKAILSGDVTPVFEFDIKSNLKLINHIKKFIRNYQYDVDYSLHNGESIFLYNFNYSEYKLFLSLTFFMKEYNFEFEINDDIEYPDWINEKIINVSLFINSIMNKYTTLNNKIKFSDIDNIINDINKEKFKIYLKNNTNNLNKTLC